MINTLEENLNEIKYNELKIALVGLYLPVDEDYKKFKPIVKKWNNKLNKFTKKKNNRKYINLYQSFNQDIHFVDEIEPSSSGSEIIADIIESIQN